MSSAATAPLRILMVEDEAVNRALLRAVLGSELSARLGPLELFDAATLAAAREALREHAPDLIILDVRLPDGDGLDLARALAGEAGNRPGVLVMSASVLPADRDAARRAGGDAFLGKPFRPAELVVMLDELAAARRHGEGHSSLPDR